MGSIQNTKPSGFFNTMKIPLGYPTDPAPNKILLLWIVNKKVLRTPSSVTLEQYPFLRDVSTPDGSTSAIIPILQTIKISTEFNKNQSIFQQFNVYKNVVGSLSSGLVQKSAIGLEGFSKLALNKTMANVISNTQNIVQPSGTAPNALSNGPNQSTGGQGLVNGFSANNAGINLEQKWNGSSQKIRTSVFSSQTPPSQDNVEYRSDEGAYGLMISGRNGKFEYTGVNGDRYGFGQLWVGGSGGIRKNKEYPTQAYRMFVKYDNNVRRDYVNLSTSGFTFGIPNVGEVGYDVKESGDPNKPGYRYGDSVGSTVTNDEYRNSDIMVQYKFYSDPAQQFPSKVTDKQRTDKINDSLKISLSKIQSSNFNRSYKVDVPNDSTLIYSGKSSQNGYDRLFNTKLNREDSPFKYPLGVMQSYRESRVVDNSVSENPVQKSKKLPTAGHFDAINTLTVLDKDKKINDSKMQNWMEWQPYVDDQIAFCFYDVVNEKYIPFRATVKGISENGNASFEELPFIGRADKIYSYGGFNRNLSLNFTIVISSIVELAPTWQRINYLTTLIKPSNYTKANMTVNGDTIYNRFMVPPMVMLTIGDMYKDQPILIQSITTTIPDDASWETLNEENSGTGWEYLSSYITSPGAIYGQLPRTVDIQMTLILLEKERAIVGGANFGHAPRDEKLDDWNRTTVPNNKEPNKFHKSLVVKVLDTTKATPDVLGPPAPTASPASNAFPLLTTSVNNPFTVPYNIGNTNNAAPPFSGGGI